MLVWDREKKDLRLEKFDREDAIAFIDRGQPEQPSLDAFRTCRINQPTLNELLNKLVSAGVQREQEKQYESSIETKSRCQTRGNY